MLLYFTIAPGYCPEGADRRFAIKAEDVKLVTRVNEGFTGIFVCDLNPENVLITDEKLDDVVAKLNAVLQPIYAMRQVVNIPANPPTDPCGCPPGTVCGNVMCPRRYVVSF